MTTRPDIAYCIPVMNRQSDLELTLAKNLDVVSCFPGKVRVVVACFDVDPQCREWLYAQFSEEIATGLLEVLTPEPLSFWHFSRAKNVFRDAVAARYYSSLDGDNYLSIEEVERTLELVADPSAPVLIHHFTGRWGDGTSGRITLPTEMFQAYGYIEEILPRQFDEIGVILQVLIGEENIRFVTRPGGNVFEKSGWAGEFLRRNGLRVQHEEADLGPVLEPENARGSNYVRSDGKLRFFQELNSAYTCCRMSLDDAARNFFHDRLQMSQREFARSSEVLDCLVELFAGDGLDALSNSDVPTLYAVNRNNQQFLGPWLRHYRKLGVKRFVVVDDGSCPPLEQEMPGNDVYVVRPRFGSFKTSKVFWLKVLMHAFQKPGSWVLTADIDEFIDVPGVVESGLSSLEQIIARADKNGWGHIPGLLLDMMPAPGVDLVSPGEFETQMEWYQFRPPCEDYGYADQPGVKWAFGKYWPISYAIDIRFRLYGTLDNLRKIPLFRFDPALDLNQGFHGLSRYGSNIDMETLLAPGRPLLPVRHYKMVKVFADTRSENGVFERVDQYFDRTRQNLARIENADRVYIARVWRTNPFVRRYLGADTCPFVHGPSDTMRRLTAWTA